MKTNPSIGPQPSHRTLACIPAIYTQADMSALSDRVMKASLRKPGKSGWKRKTSLIDNCWTKIETITSECPIYINGTFVKIVPQAAK